ncbi:hypothetical protein UFOVP965_38 [uncultured Caudovirales phage]|uniref:Uncharacterized protein n=1 Tax=uncultured Caudovirales phage TaxID=2100421 RepID=A0A6J5R5U7_9CAUD|nr:hypothetical protein UFOVP965_38 [uncultured Caudovirales phage]CAB4179755.1 hypothetical protein UFOVP1035_34 [uncultured Caudovirales phage]CAB4188871.1 hypothetical protein UFOVP1181_140 [uncultured Caudovirales phage]
MSRYGIDYYGLSNYGPTTIVSFDAYPFTAASYGYSKIKLDWVDPTGAWSKLRLVRNSYGHPVNAFDGTVILEVTNGSDPTTYIDETGLAEGAFYYYSIFVFEVTNYAWYRAGDAIGLSVKRFGGESRLYEYMPEVYKISHLYTIDTTQENTALSNFLSLFGFHLDMYQTLTDLLLHRYDLQKVSGLLLPSLLNQFGLSYEPEVGYQQSRILVRDVVQFYKEKGSAAGLHEYIKAFTGWAVPTISTTAPNPTTEGVVVSHNIMLDYNDSSFEEGVGHWVSTSNASITQLSIKELTHVAITSNVAGLTIGAHNYKVGNKVNIELCPSPRFNTAGTPVTITAISSTTISYALTASDVPIYATTGVVTPFPLPWEETTAPVNFPNKQSGILAVTNTSASPATVAIECGEASPITTGIPVTTGLQYTFSVKTSAGSTTRTITLKIEWYDRFATLISTSTGTGAADVVGVLLAGPTVTGTAPAGAYYACPVISIASVAGSASNEFHYFDALQFEQAAAATDFDEARQLHISVKASRINELVNPSFASPLTPWALVNATDASDTVTPSPRIDVYSITKKALTTNVATLTTSLIHIMRVGDTVNVSGVDATFDGAYLITAVTANTFSYALVTANVPEASDTGTAYVAGDVLELTATGASVTLTSTTAPADLMGIHYPSSFYTFSLYAQAATAENITLSITWYDDTQTFISTDTGVSEAVGTAWTRISTSAIAPATAAYASVELAWTATISDVLLLDEALFENTPFVLEYFDGNGGPANAADFFWEGNAIDAGRSHLYKNRFVTQSRISDSILEFLTLGSTIALYMAQPNT